MREGTPATTAPRPRVLIAEDDATVRQSLDRALGRLSLDVATVEDGEQAQSLLARQGFDVVLTDLAMPRADGFAVLDASIRQHPRTPVIILTAVGSMPDCVRAMRAGAFDFVSKPYDLGVLQATMQAALGAHQARRERLCSGHLPFLGASPAAHALGEMILRVAESNATVLITGETGTGKDVVARALHQASPRGNGPLVAVNCGAIPEGLIESELFGHVPGAFTGATSAREGRVREANGGTLFLDEIGDLPLPLQTRLLRVVQERLVSPVGGSTTHAVDVRFVAASNRDLGQMVRAGQFREDLYFRLNVVPLEVPPLRERVTDIPALAAHFLTHLARPGGRPLPISDRALVMLQLHKWPGNVRELKHALERMAILDRDGVLDVDDVPPRLRAGAAGQAFESVVGLDDQRIDLGAVVAQFERALIDNALRATGGNRSQAALRLGIGRTTLLDKLKRQR